MTLKRLFRSAVRELREREVTFAVAGGFAADLYRREPRLTIDIDLTIFTDSHARDTGIAVVEALGLSAGIVRKADMEGGPPFAIRRRNTAPWMIVGRPEGRPDAEGVDILLPAVPWVRIAVERAQSNLVDFGFGKVPTLTLEDVILSKLHALGMAKLRAKDLDDLQSIFEAGHEFGTAYLAGRIQELGIGIPTKAKPFLPDSLLNIAGQRRRRK